ncbi:hypothetical protein TcG_10620 [Trypanosoma cruzi]|nr:hypothetical protein TcG_10620 [Trypanosoma cruzi]
MRTKNSANRTHSDSCHQKQKPQRASCASATRQRTRSNAHTQNNQRDAEGTTALRNTNAPSPAVLLLSLPAPSIAHRSEQPENLPSVYEQREEHVGTCSCWARIGTPPRHP